MSQNHMSQSQVNQFAIANNTFGESKQYVCDAEMYRFWILTDFYMPAASKFGFARKMWPCTMLVSRHSCEDPHFSVSRVDHDLTTAIVFLRGYKIIQK